jgi:hypothetical protein
MNGSSAAAPYDVLAASNETLPFCRRDKADQRLPYSPASADEACLSQWQPFWIEVEITNTHMSERTDVFRLLT